ncbi:uncharacterized protein LOC129923670 [Biomphalaria glabrata]|uniref:Uncharacterized protein LOC129923670 n=1 Tax=Biomphalaria glabrata TaxID=6526 RepID=A0A9W2Z9N8_BIOGL|nr:uncharacterized protein LOC129923670 [Biomphalaria glabrata]KAI8730596.1 CAunnamed protein product [Biomphalaria glabrata]
MKRLDLAENGEGEPPMPVVTTRIIAPGELQHRDCLEVDFGDTSLSGARLDDVEWQHVDRVSDIRFSSLASPRADSSLPPISKTSSHVTGGLRLEPSTPKKLVHSLRLSKSQNSLTKLKSSESGDFGFLRNNAFFDQHVEKHATHTPTARVEVREPGKSNEGSNVRTFTKSPAYQQKLMPWESARLSPVISADNINNRVIKFLAADNKLHSVPASRSKLKTSVPSRAMYPSASQNTMTSSHSTARLLASKSHERLNPAFSHSPVPRISPFPKAYPTKSRNIVRTREFKQFGPQAKSTEKGVSIRRKIEQYRKKCDEQYTDTLKRLKLEGDHDSKPSHSRPTALPFSGIDFTKILEERIHEHVADDDGVSQREKLKQASRSMVSEYATNARIEKRSLVTSSIFESRPVSRATWKTWRDVNESDAYNDVAQYIRDNDLMDAERERWITTWLEDVQSAMKNMEAESEMNLMDS